MEQKEPRGFRIDVSLQLRMFPEPNMLSGRPTSVERERAGFDRRDPRGIFVGPVRLDEHLKRAKLKSPLIVRRVLEKHDWSEFEAAYKCGGRPAYEPMSMVGLILYGNMNAVDSLRGLEELARKDLGCMWVSGGITPDHSVIGRFIIEHGEFLEGAFFEQITRTVLKQTQSGGRRLAGDGTIIQAAAGRYRTLKSEALREFAKKARERATNEGGTRLSQRAALAEHAVGVVDERNQERGKKSRDPTGARVSPIEPDAVVQKQKDRSFAPSYKPSVVANEKRIIVGHAVHGSAEIVAIEAMLEQAERISQQKVETLMLDAGYCTNDVIEQALEREIDLLCPTGSLDKTDGELHRKSSKRFPRSDFSYDAVSDTYRCPAAETLTRVTPRSRAQTLKYGTDKCPGCALRSQCTRDSRGKTLERNHWADARDALAQTMSHPQARLAYSQRKAMVEPVFADLKECQKFRRFRRRGLVKVRVEFSLRATAHNLRRLVALLCAALARLRPLGILSISSLGSNTYFRWRHLLYTNSRLCFG